MTDFRGWAQTFEGRGSINYDEPGIRIDLTRAGADGKELPRRANVRVDRKDAGDRSDARQ